MTIHWKAALNKLSLEVAQEKKDFVDIENFVQTEIIEKIIDDIKNQIDENTAGIPFPTIQESAIKEVVQQLKDKWL